MLQFVQGIYDSIFTEAEYRVLIVGPPQSGKTTLFEQLKYMYAVSQNPNAGPAPVAAPNALAPSPPVASEAYLASKKIRPTVGMNYLKCQHFFERRPAQGSRSSSLTQAPPPPPDPTRTPLVLWDLGGAPSLQALWRAYYPQCQAVIFVVDAALLAAEDAAEDAAQRARRIRAAYAPVRALLEQLLWHPQLQGVPFLLLLNKVDVRRPGGGCITAAELMEAIDLVEMATSNAFYAHPNALLHSGAATDATHAAHAAPDVSSSGVGSCIFKMEQVSARTGQNVAGALDWLVRQLRQSARAIDAEDGGSAAGHKNST
ncbi:hypothetical protein STCU_05307 [Strigomonas culicis]|uniref:Arf/Sar family, other n=1 Tax=Strigomonas culicis TaxID=28005 RepID=S9UGQ8_9TRYP|nr:hypothetical protein STCU_05307 [Strigomonas culicis]|eukprot:EPY28088.1 hypothetical protein STCU_05307 [Strigomonas culicis]